MQTEETQKTKKSNRFLATIKKTDAIFDRNWICLLLVVFFAFIFCSVMSFKTFPIAEGWYSIYARLILQGKKPYVDFEFLYTPLYAYLITFHVAIFGETIISLRILGIVVFVGIAIVVYFTFTHVFPKWLSAFCAIIAVLVMQSEIVQTFYDYVRFFDFFNLLGILFCLKWLKNADEKNKKSFVFICLSGIAFVLSFMIRQSSGLINTFFGFLFIIFMFLIKGRNKVYLKYLLFYLIGVIFTLAIFASCLLAGGMLRPCIVSVFGGGVESKGGFWTIALKWLINIFSEFYIVLLSALFAVLIIILVFKKISKFKDLGDESFISVFFFGFLLLFILALFIYPISAFFAFGGMSLLITIFFIIHLFIFISTCLYLIVKNKNSNNIEKLVFLLALLCGYIVMTAFGSGTSGGISKGQSALSYGLMIGLLYYCLKLLVGKYRLQFLSLCFGLVIAVSSAALKIVYPYNWWNLSEPALRVNTEYTDLAMLKGLKVSKNTKKILEDITHTIIDETEEGDSLYCFPQIPIFYMLTDITPTVMAVVPWFDVAADQTVLNDLEMLKANKPKFMVIAFCGESVISVHEKSFRATGTSAQRKVYEWVEECIDDGTYQVVYDYDINGEDDGTARQVGSYPIKLLKLN